MTTDWSDGSKMRKFPFRLGLTMKETIQAMATLTGDYIMEDTKREIIGRDMIRMYDSLHQAVIQAGGTGASFDSRGIESMTVLELMAHLAANGVRFYCNKTHRLELISKPTVDPRQCKDEK